MHPVLHTIMPHNGVDFAAPPGTPVYSTAAGVVKSVGDSGPCGNMVQVAHANGLVSAYCHLSRFAAGLHAGQHVDPRQLVGYVGQTGRTTGPHLHFAIKRGESFLDPLALKLDGVRVVPLADRSEFERMRAELDIALDGIAQPAAAAFDGGVSSDDDAGTDETVFEEAP
jgi:murein DD-endopeptidase MepM/ murein hydrolase activator NlpD